MSRLARVDEATGFLKMLLSEVTPAASACLSVCFRLSRHLTVRACRATLMLMIPLAVCECCFSKSSLTASAFRML
eukprot:6168084-Karenia_brevis.AAC.1